MDHSTASPSRTQNWWAENRKQVLFVFLCLLVTGLIVWFVPTW